MTTGSKKPLKLFYCYAREDKALRNELDIHLSSLKRQNLVTSWHDGEIGPGTEWEKEIDTHLRNADIILLLVTPHFLASDYCYEIEMKHALERHQAGTVRVIPIILRHTFWQDAPFSSLQILPTDAKPVTQWSDRDEAFWDITVGIRKAVLDLCLLLKTKDEGIALDDLKRYEETLAYYEQTIRLAPNYSIAYIGKAIALSNLKRYEEALAAYEQAIRLDPNLAGAYYNKGLTLDDLKRYEEALAAYEQAIRLNPNFALPYYNKGITLDKLRRSKEAQQCYEKARRLGYNG